MCAVATETAMEMALEVEQGPVNVKLAILVKFVLNVHPDSILNNHRTLHHRISVFHATIHASAIVDLKDLKGAKCAKMATFGMKGTDASILTNVLNSDTIRVRETRSVSTMKVLFAVSVSIREETTKSTLI